MKTSSSSTRRVSGRVKRPYLMEVGTSGFMTSQKQWLSLHNIRNGLNCIEINSSFYRLPTPNTIAKLNAFPESVSFVFKVSRYLTHLKRLKDGEEPWKLFWKSIEPLKTRIVTVLFQMPPSFHNKPENVERIENMKRYVKDVVPVTFEFRDKSWLTDTTYALFKKLKWCIAGTVISKSEGTKWMGTMPNGVYMPPVTNDMTYMRIHGKRGFRGELSQSQLKSLRKRILSRKTFVNVVMFNNVFFDKRSQTCKVGDEKVKYAAVCNAVDFSSI
jgi:uncharacterized protein YecE (DUF72 family)